MYVYFILIINGFKDQFRNKNIIKYWKIYGVFYQNIFYWVVLNLCRNYMVNFYFVFIYYSVIICDNFYGMKNVGIRFVIYDRILVCSLCNIICEDY